MEAHQNTEEGVVEVEAMVVEGKTTEYWVVQVHMLGGQLGGEWKQFSSQNLSILGTRLYDPTPLHTTLEVVMGTYSVEETVAVVVEAVVVVVVVFAVVHQI